MAFQHMSKEEVMAAGSAGGRSTSKQKLKTARENGKKGGRPPWFNCETCGVKFRSDAAAMQVLVNCGDCLQVHCLKCACVTG